MEEGPKTNVNTMAPYTNKKDIQPMAGAVHGVTEIILRKHVEVQAEE